MRGSIKTIACQIQAMIAHFRERAMFRGIPDPTPDYRIHEYERLLPIVNELAALLERRVRELNAPDWRLEDEGAR
jgi:hypothetical protein